MGVSRADLGGKNARVIFGGGLESQATMKVHAVVHSGKGQTDLLGGFSKGYKHAKGILSEWIGV